MAGQVLVDGVPLTDIGLAAWRGRIAATFQDFVRFELLAGEAVGVGDLPRIDLAPALSEALRRCTANTAAGMLLAAVSPGIKGAHARNPTVTGASVSNSRSATG